MSFSHQSSWRTDLLMCGFSMISHGRIIYFFINDAIMTPFMTQFFFFSGEVTFGKIEDVLYPRLLRRVLLHRGRKYIIIIIIIIIVSGYDCIMWWLTLGDAASRRDRNKAGAKQTLVCGRCNLHTGDFKRFFGLKCLKRWMRPESTKPAEQILFPGHNDLCPIFKTLLIDGK